MPVCHLLLKYPAGSTKIGWHTSEGFANGVMGALGPGAWASFLLPDTCFSSLLSVMRP